MSDLRQKATNPRQYDQPRLRWEEEGLANSPTRLHFHYYLECYFPSLRGKNVLDVGSGTGHLSKLLFRLGAKSVTGIEPSRKNVHLSHQHFPKLKVYPTTLDQAKPRKRFDIIVVVMAMEHLPNLDQAFRKFFQLLLPGGQCYIMTGSYRYHTSPRFDYTMNKQKMRDGSIVVGVERPYGILYDIVRPVKLYQQAGSRTGLKLIKHVPLYPSPRLIKVQPKYTIYRRKAITQLFIFQKP